MKKFAGSIIRFSAGFAFLIAVMSNTTSCTKSAMDNMTGTGNKGGSGGPGANEVWIQNMAFTPSTITVAAGTTVIWTNKDPMDHNVTSDPALFASPSMSTGTTYSFNFANAGTYNYICTIHPTMKGTVIVN